MGQLVMIDEDEYNDLQLKAKYCDYYKRHFETIEKELYPDYISISPVNAYQYDIMVLEEMKIEIRNNRKKWWKK